MAEIAEGGGGGGKGHGKKRAKKNSTKVDMTPMVDLAFLLLTFFVLTSTFSKPKVMSLVYPAKPDPLEHIEPQLVNNAITFIVTEDKLYYYKGAFYGPNGGSKGEPPTQLLETNFGPKGVRKLLSDENAYVIRTKNELAVKLQKKEIVDSVYTNRLNDAKKSKGALKVLIKTDTKATCKNFIDLIDELKINDIGVIAPVDIMQSELDLLNAKSN